MRSDVGDMKYKLNCLIRRAKKRKIFILKSLKEVNNRIINYKLKKQGYDFLVHKQNHYSRALFFINEKIKQYKSEYEILCKK
jgi:hypothetical protein